MKKFQKNTFSITQLEQREINNVSGGIFGLPALPSGRTTLRFKILFFAGAGIGFLVGGPPGAAVGGAVGGSVAVVIGGVRVFYATRDYLNARQ